MIAQDLDELQKLTDNVQTPNVVASTQTINSGEKTSVDQSTVADPAEILRKTNTEKFSNFNSARVYLQQIRDSWKPEVEATLGRRATRDVRIDVDALRESGVIKEDETFIPVRIIDMNIKREQPSYINYLRNSRRIAIFTCTSQPQLDTQLLEQEFTKGMTYPEWETPHFKCVDGSQTHGWDTIEVVFDTARPLKVSLEQVGHDKLFFSYDALHLQNCSRVIRQYDLTIQQLMEYVVKFGFSNEQVQNLIASKKDAGAKEESTFRVYKCFYKLEGVVYVGWFALDYGTSDWLKAPVKLFLGRRIKQQVEVMVDVPIQIGINPDGTPLMHVTKQPTLQEQWVNVDETNYPLFVLPYQETEKQKITEHDGRVFLDANKQEAHTAVLTGFVNGITRASNVYGSPSQDTADGGPLKVADVKLVNGAVMTRPMNFWHPDYPDPSVLKALQYMDGANANEVGDTNFAALNRQDSRKTATELTQAQNESQKLDSVQLVLYSTHIRLVYSFAWLIVQSQALQGLLPSFLLTLQANGQYVQDVNTISQTFDVRAAGDVDVIQKAQMVQQMKQDWPVIQTTALAQTFLIDLVKLQYPNDAERYEQILLQGDQKKQVIQGLATLVMELVKANPSLIASLSPEQQQQMAQLAQTTQAVLAQP
jgi:hypothetical protein